jgi:hypothetical protein
MPRYALQALSGTLPGLLGLAALACGGAAVWWETPELHVDTGAHPATAHMELLGEYPSNIHSIEIQRDGSSDPVWKIAADGDFFQIHSVPLVVGDNPVATTLYRGHARRLVPASGATFRLDAGTAYRITICPSALLGLCRSADFVLPAH